MPALTRARGVDVAECCRRWSLPVRFELVCKTFFYPKWFPHKREWFQKCRFEHGDTRNFPVAPDPFPIPRVMRTHDSELRCDGVNELDTKSAGCLARA